MSKNDITRAFGRLGLQLKKHSPEILVAAGIIGGVAATVMACKATTKIAGVIDKTKESVEMIHQGVEDGEVVTVIDGEEHVVPYSEEDAKKDLAIHYAKAGLEFAKIYGPAVLLGAASITCILVSNGIMRKRNLALAAAYMAEHTSFKEYRGRLIERFGKEIDRELKYNIKAKEIEETTVDENGEVKTEKKVADTVDGKLIQTSFMNYSPYAIVFDESCTGWCDDAEANKFFLIQQQRYANDLLQRRGHVLLNDVYDMLGVKRTKYGAQVGWMWNKNGEYEDNYIDFGMFDIVDENARDFINGNKKIIILDFNVDGPILDLI